MLESYGSLAHGDATTKTGSTCDVDVPRPPFLSLSFCLSVKGLTLAFGFVTKFHDTHLFSGPE